MRKVYGLPVSVYKDGSGYDCTRNGISSRYDRLILIGEGIEGFREVDLDNPPENVVHLVKRNIGGREYMHVEPLDGQYSKAENRKWYMADENFKWYMAGGNFVFTSDSRFPCDYPLSIHDRYEG